MLVNHTSLKAEIRTSIGFVDHLSDKTCIGWAVIFDGVNYEATTLELLVNDRVVRDIIPSHYRADLEAAGIGNGVYGFEVSLDDIPPGSDVTVRTPDGTVLPFSGSARQGSEFDMGQEVAGAVGNINLPAIKIDRKLTSKSVTENTFRSLCFFQSDFDKNAFSKCKKVCLFVTYSRTGNVSQYQIRQVREWQKAGYFVIAVRAGDRLTLFDKSARLGDVDLGKANIGYDFGSWWVGYQWLMRHAHDDILRFKSVALCNDSFYGRVSRDGIAAIENLDGDLVGVADNFDHCHHIQSFFVIAKGQYLNSGEFLRSLGRYRFPSEKADVIRFGELLLSREATEGGAPISAVHCYRDLVVSWIDRLDSLIDREVAARRKLGLGATHDEVAAGFQDMIERLMTGECLNPTHLFWDAFLTDDIAIVKRELLFKNPLDIPNYYSLLEACVAHGILEDDNLRDLLPDVTQFDLSNHVRFALAKRFAKAGLSTMA